MPQWETEKNKPNNHAHSPGEKSQEWKEHYRQIFNTNATVMLVIDPENGYILDANQAACQFYGYDYQTLTKMSIQQINTMPEEWIRQELKRARTKESANYEFRHRLASGEIRNVEVHAGPLKTQGGIFLFVVIHDITELKRTQKALRESEEKYRVVVENIHEAICVVQNERIVFANQVCAGWANMTPEQMMGKSFSEIMFHKGQALHKVTQHHQEMTEETMQFDAWEFQMTFPDGTPHWLLINTVRILWEDEPATLNIVRDITQRKQIENALRESKELYFQLFEAESDAVVLIENTTSQILEANSAALLLYGYTREEFLSMKNTDVSAEPDETRRVTESTPIIVDNIIRIPLRWHRKRDGTVFPVEITGRFFHWKGRDVHIAAIRDITERRQAEEKILEQQKQLEAANARLEVLSVIDPLTELFNRRAFDERLTAEISHAARHKKPLSLVLVDIDHFKAYNDTFGHPAGDEILQQLAQILATHSRGTDFAARYGGEEFILILPDTGVEGALFYSERFRRVIEEAEWPRRNITASFGVTTFEPDSSPRIELQLVTEADQALYYSKNTGRNRVTHVSQLP